MPKYFNATEISDYDIKIIKDGLENSIYSILKDNLLKIDHLSRKEVTGVETAIASKLQSLMLNYNQNVRERKKCAGKQNKSLQAK